MIALLDLGGMPRHVLQAEACRLENERATLAAEVRRMREVITTHQRETRMHLAADARQPSTADERLWSLVLDSDAKPEGGAEG